MPHALIVEDDSGSAAMLAEVVSTEGFSTAVAQSLRDARQQLAFRPPDVVLLDLTLPDGNGMELFDNVDSRECEIVLITGHASVETSVQALRLGAADYLLKPLNVDRLRAVLDRVRNGGESRGRLREGQQMAEAEGRFGRLWGRSEPMKEIYRQIGRVAPTAVTALVIGESGTGKELVAHTIHDLSRRAKAPFLAVNCGAISPQLIESELFGHEKGSFTGAVRQHRGFFERSDGGTLFLDEITEMPPELQVKLLRVLETGTFTPVGADKPMSCDVRIIAASNRVPLEAVAQGRLREDLYYRLAVFPIELPPLRERPEDIPLIAEHFLESLNTRENANKRLSERATQLLKAYSWPGNVRELRNAIHRGFILAEGDLIDADCLPLEHVAGTMTEPAAPGAQELPRAGSFTAPSGGDSATATGEWLRETSVRDESQREVAMTGGDETGATATSVASASDSAPQRPLAITIGMTIADAERELIVATLAHCAGHRERAAEMLGISAKTLYNRLKQYGGF
ncbi:MAG TPA: sigma-54 dependent transcriptional regulator [Burkholderiaceae bacterium]|nr:sigma-54 dependent transcriptional regulator [Burkholderiaceae bacterium]